MDCTMRFRLSRTMVVVLLALAVILLALYLSRQPPGSGPVVIQLPSIVPAPSVAPATSAGPAGPPTLPIPASGNRNLALGNPSNAVHDANQPNNYLIERPQYALSYNRDHGIPNWVSWQVTKQDLGDVQRSPTFSPDTSLPKGWYRVVLDDYTGSGYDRGHMCPSADRTATAKDNLATFILTNVLPQAPGNNRSTWEHLEAFSRTLVGKGHTLYIVAGGDGTIGTIAKGKVTVPAYTWKIIVVLPKGATDSSQITADTPVIAVRIPNGLNDKLGDWDQYRVTVASIEQATGYHFFGNLAPDIQQALKSHVAAVPTN
jgi:endonuclease G